MTIEVSIIDLNADWALVEGIVEGRVERRYIPRSVYDIQSRDPLRIEVSEFLGGIDACEVDLEGLLGSAFPLVRLDVLMEHLKGAGLWTRKDYANNAHVIMGILRRHLHRLDATTIVNSVMQAATRER